MKEPFEALPRDLPGGGKSLIEFNLNLWSAGAQARRPLRVDVAATLRDPNAAGWAQGSEVGDLTLLHERLEVLMSRRASAEYALRVTGEGKQVNTFYVASKLGLLRNKDPREVLGAALARFGESSGYPLTASFEEDPEWSALLGVYPTWDPAQWALDRNMLVHLAKQRDAIHARRPVAHRVYLPSREACRAFLKDARKLRFKAEGGPQPAGADKPAEFVLVVVRQEPTLATWHLHPVVLTVKALATTHGGVYDGWETELIESLEPPPLSPPGGPKLG